MSAIKRAEKHVKTALKRLLLPHFNIYRLKDSAFYRSFLRVAYPSYAATKSAERNFYDGILSTTGRKLIFDIGANKGDKATIFANSAEHVVVVEPNPSVVEILNRRFERQTNISVVQSGVGASSGVADFYLFEDANALNTFSTKWKDNVSGWLKSPTKVQIPVITLDELISRYGAPDYIKIDVEGFESEVLQGLSQQVPLTSFECNLPIFQNETVSCISKMSSLQPSAKFNYCTVDPPSRFDSDKWLSSSEMTQLVMSERFNYMEVYCSVPELH